MANYPTPHINAKPGDFGKTVLMPGDPLRSKFIAENFLENAVLVNNVRGIHGYTGTYHGVKISVMASGMVHRYLFVGTVYCVWRGKYYAHRLDRRHAGEYQPA